MHLACSSKVFTVHCLFCHDNARALTWLYHVPTPTMLYLGCWTRPASALILPLSWIANLSQVLFCPCSSHGPALMMPCLSCAASATNLRCSALALPWHCSSLTCSNTLFISPLYHLALVWIGLHCTVLCWPCDSYFCSILSCLILICLFASQPFSCPAYHKLILLQPSSGPDLILILLQCGGQWASICEQILIRQGICGPAILVPVPPCIAPSMLPLPCTTLLCVAMLCPGTHIVIEDDQERVPKLHYAYCAFITLDMHWLQWLHWYYFPWVCCEKLHVLYTFPKCFTCWFDSKYDRCSLVVQIHLLLG